MHAAFVVDKICTFRLEPARASYLNSIRYSYYKEYDIILILLSTYHYGVAGR